ncbi:MAG: hypothetical protein HOV94_12575 [Saccharothrix sp.]|nr:hypothetical protein [Saccharothrix sp.]
MTAHTVLIGYGETGRAAALAVPAGIRDLVVLDIDPSRTSQAVDDGVRAVLGDGRMVDVLFSVDVAGADSVIVAVADAADAARITWAVRRAGPEVTLVVLLRSPMWRDFVVRLGADRVVVTGQVVGRELALSLRRAAPVHRPADGLTLTTRPARPGEVGRRPAELGPLTLVVVRDGARRWRDDPALSTVRADDELVVVQPEV